MLSKQALQEILELLSQSEGNFIILEKDLPKFVILDFSLYKNIINKSKTAAQNLLQAENGAVIQKIFVTGGQTSLGKAVVDSLKNAGHEVSQIEGDWSNPAILNEALGADKFHTVLHLAELSGSRESFADPEAYFVANVEKSIALLKAMVKHNVRQMVYKSAAAGNSPYSRTKLIFEDILKFYHASFGINSVSLRLPKLVEPREISADLESELFENPVNAVMAAATGKVACLSVPNVGDLTSDGSPRLEIATLPAAASAFQFAAGHVAESSGSMIYMMDAASLTLNQLIEIVLETTQKMVATSRTEAGELWEQTADNSKPLSAAGWSPKELQLGALIKQYWSLPPAPEPISLGELLSGNYTPFIKPHNS